MNLIFRQGLCVALMFALPAVARCESDALQQDASWQLVNDEQVASILRDGLYEQDVNESDIESAAKRFLAQLQSPSPDRLDSFIASASDSLPKLKKVVEQFEQSPTSLGEDPFLGFSVSIRNQARLWAGRVLVRARLFDEALPLLQSLTPRDVIAPTEMLFYRGVCYHALLKKDEAIDDLTMLLQRSDEIPRRYARTAELMLADIESLKEDSLDEIARMMNDVSRRLDLGRSDEPVVDREQTIIDKLDKMIEKMEEDQKKRQQQQQQASGGGAKGSKSPMQESQIAGGRGAGDVDKKSLSQNDGWGNLPAAQRQEALQKISQDLPTHYRDAIEAYFRKLATDAE